MCFFQVPVLSFITGLKTNTRPQRSRGTRPLEPEPPRPPYCYYPSLNPLPIQSRQNVNNTWLLADDSSLMLMCIFLQLC